MGDLRMERYNKILEYIRTGVPMERDLRSMGDVYAANAIARALFYLGRAAGQESQRLADLVRRG